ncbi:MAG: YncE family protein [bacterium]
MPVLTFPRMSSGPLKKGAFLAGLVGWLVKLAFLPGCAHLPPETVRTGQSPDGSLAVHVQAFSPRHEEISFSIHSLQIFAEDGRTVTFPVEQELKTISSPSRISLEKKIPPGHYQKIGLLLARPVLYQSGTPMALAYSEEFTLLDYPFLITPQGRTHIHIDLEVGSRAKDGMNAKGIFLSAQLIPKKRGAALKSLMLYVTNTGDNTVTAIDRMTNSVVSGIQVGKQPKGIVVNPEGTYAYVANSGSHTVSVIDTMTHEPEDAIDLPLGLGPSAVAISPDGKYLFTANTESNNVTIIDTDLKRSIDTFEAGHQPVDLKISPSGKCLYVVHRGSHDLYLFKLEEHLLGVEKPAVAARIPIRSEPWGLAVTKEDPYRYEIQQEDRIFVANFGSSSLSSFKVNVDKLDKLVTGELSTDDIVKSLSVLQGEYGPAQIVLDEAGRRILVTNLKDHSVSSFSRSMNMQENRYPVGLRPTGLALDEDRNYLYVVNSGEESLSVLDLRQKRLITSIRVGNEPFGIDLIRR